VSLHDEQHFAFFPSFPKIRGARCVGQGQNKGREKMTRRVQQNAQTDATSSDVRTPHTHPIATTDTTPAATRPQVQAIIAANAPTVFISLRFAEAMLEAKALQQDLYAQGLSAFPCDIPEGQDSAGTLLTALIHCKLAVILGTRTYGRDTECGFSAYDELRYIVEVKKPIFLIKMCQAFEEQYAVFRLPSSISHFSWQPATDAERKRPPRGEDHQTAWR
jgi:hypothetical protein